MVNLSIKPDISENPLFPGNDVKKFMTRHQRVIYDQPTEEELQARTVIAENIPANYLLENLEKLFRWLGRVKSFKVKNPQDPNLAGCSRDVLTIREGWWTFERTLSGLHAIVEYETEEEANKIIRYFDRYPQQIGGFRVRSRRDYSIASEKRDNMKNPKKRRERLTEKPPLQELWRFLASHRNQGALSDSLCEMKATLHE